ncbi:MAG: hypothetical protein CMH27_11545 [Micavibrio sp.]|nr:hypothetical protein [Micavibrio sp.]|tara:strand:- start:647 stop:1309 length:663 start_codon:yes stop_codon:yes gene_type:complete
MDFNLLTDGLDVQAVPQKFKDPETGAINIPAIVNSYTELEKKMSSGAGSMAPDSPEEYCVDCKHGMFTPDPDVNYRLHAKGLSQEQVQEVYDLAAEKLVPMIVQLAGDFQADREIEKLVSHFGGQEQWKEVSRQLLAFGQKNMPKDVLENLSSSYEGVMALYRMMKGEEPMMSRADAEVDAGSDMNELKSMMRDPKYWKEKDPAFVAKVTEGFKKMYGGE